VVVASAQWDVTAWQYRSRRAAVVLFASATRGQHHPVSRLRDADAAFHGDGLTSLQSRKIRGATTLEIRANMTRPRRLSLRTLIEPALSVKRRTTERKLVDRLGVATDITG
jgi:hypothetical protein